MKLVLSGQKSVQLAALDLTAIRSINDFQSETAEITGAPDPLTARAALFVLASMIVSGVVLSALTPLDRLVSARGRISSQAPTIVVQPLDTAIVRSIDVHEGQVVHRGQLLATFDPTFSTADLSQLQRQNEGLTEEIGRLQAELENDPFVPTPGNPYGLAQLAIWTARRAEMKSALSTFDDKIESSQAAVRRSAEDIAHYRARVEIVAQVEDMRKLSEQLKVGSRLNLLLASDNRAEVSRALAQSENTLRAGMHDLDTIRSQREDYRLQWRSKVATDLVARRVDRDRAHEELAKAEKRRELVELHAVEDAIVLNVGRVSVGSVLRAAERVFELVPLTAPLQVEADIDATDQGFVSVGDQVQVKLDAYRFSEHGAATGVVRAISGDVFTHGEEQKREEKPYYRVYIDLQKVALRNVPGDFRLIPGMPLTAEIIVGSRTIASYFIERAIQTTTGGMHEP